MVLKKHPDHGETLAMRGLILNCLDRKAEAYEHVKRGLSKDIRSHVCWHVFGLVHRSDRDYKEAVKCYRNALRIEPDNGQILRDLSLLQVQLRDRHGYLETRHALLRLKPNQRINWVGIALANHLLGRHRRAYDVLGAYEKTLDKTDIESKYEHSEMLLYKVELLRDGGVNDEAAAELDAAEPMIVDRTAVRELRAELLLERGRYDEAAAAFTELIALNPEQYGYHAGLQSARLRRPPPPPAPGPQTRSPYGASRLRRPSYAHLSAEERATLLELCAELEAAHPKALAPKRIALDVLPLGGGGAAAVAAFEARFAAYTQPLLRKGVPSLFASVRPLYAEPAKRDAIGALLVRWRDSLLAHGTFDGGPPEPSQAEGRGGPEAPSTLMWVRFMLAQHHDEVGEYAAALAEVDAAIAHTPTLIELYLLKGARSGARGRGRAFARHHPRWDQRRPHAVPAAPRHRPCGRRPPRARLALSICLPHGRRPAQPAAPAAASRPAGASPARPVAARGVVHVGDRRPPARRAASAAVRAPPCARAWACRAPADRLEWGERACGRARLRAARARGGRPHVGGARAVVFRSPRGRARRRAP